MILPPKFKMFYWFRYENISNPYILGRYDNNDSESIRVYISSPDGYVERLITIFDI